MHGVTQQRRIRMVISIAIEEIRKSWRKNLSRIIVVKIVIYMFYFEGACISLCTFTYILQFVWQCIGLWMHNFELAIWIGCHYFNIIWSMKPYCITRFLLWCWLYYVKVVVIVSQLMKSPTTFEGHNHIPFCILLLDVISGQTLHRSRTMLLQSNCNIALINLA